MFISQTTDSHFANYRFSFRKLQIFISQTTDFHFAKYRFPFRKLQIFISQTTDFHFANYRFPFRKVQISISQTTDFHFANYRFPFRKLQIPISQTTDFHFHFVSSHFVSQTTVSRAVHVCDKSVQLESFPLTAYFCKIVYSLSIFICNCEIICVLVKSIWT